MVDQIDKMLLNPNINCFILNTDLSDGLGIHWISCKKLEKSNIIYIYDSLGKNNNRIYDNLMFQKIKQCNYKPYLYDNKSQYNSSNWCGWYSVLCCKYLTQCKTINECNKMIDYLFDDDNKATVNDEIQVLIHFGLSKTK